MTQAERWRARSFFLLGSALGLAWAKDIWRVKPLGIAVAILLFVGWVYCSWRSDRASSRERKPND